MGWKWGCQLFSCPCSQNVTHICSTCHTTFYVRWHRILKSGMLIGAAGGGVPAQKFGLFVTAGGWTCGKVCGSIACQYSTSHTHTPKKQKNNNKRCSDSDYSSIPAIPFGNSKNPYTRSLRFLGAAVRSTSFSLCKHSACKRSHPFGEDSGFVSHSEKQRSGQYYFKGCYGILECVFFFHLPCRLLQCVEIELLGSVGRKCGCQPFAAHIR